MFGAGAIYTSQLATTPNSGFSIWPTYVFGGVAASALYMCFATIWGWWPTGRSAGEAANVSAEPPAADGDPGTAEAETQASSMTAGGPTTAAPASLPSSPVSIRLIPELDTATNRFRLGALNRGELGRFRVEVIGTHDQDGNWIGPRSWPVPWLNGSVDAEEIPMFGKPLLDFAHFDLLGLQEDLEGTKWLNGDHWVFPSLPQPIKVRYSAVRRWSELENQHFVITVRVIRDDPPGYVDTQFKIGNAGTEPYCRELPGRPASGTPLSADPHQLRDLAVEGRLTRPAAVVRESSPVPEPTPTVTDRWDHTSDGGKVPSLMRLTQTSMSHPGLRGTAIAGDPAIGQDRHAGRLSADRPGLQRHRVASQVPGLPQLVDRPHPGGGTDRCRAGHVLEEPCWPRAADA